MAGLLTPSDGIQKLRQMESTSGIWTMRVQLVMDRSHLLIIHKQTGVSGSRLFSHPPVCGGCLHCSNHHVIMSPSCPHRLLSQEEMERFPYALLKDITAVTNQDRRDIYNNMVL